MWLHSAEGTANETFSSQMNLTVSSITYKWSATEMSEREIRTRLESIGVGVSRYGLVVVLTLIGLLKFTSPEATGIQPLVAHSPLMSWMYASNPPPTTFPTTIRHCGRNPSTGLTCRNGLYTFYHATGAWI